MNIWLLHVGELLPIDGDVRLFRYGILADMLVQRGHTVTRWAPTFVHAYKRQRAASDKTIWLNPNYRIELVYAPGYPKNISWQRIRFHRQLEAALRQRFGQEAPPDIILAGIPTPGMCLTALRYAQRHDIPLVVDVRDLWPDIYLTPLPTQLHPLAQKALWPAHQTNKELFRGATAIWGVSESYLNWGLRYAGRSRNEWDTVFPLGYPKPDFPKQKIEEERNKLIDMGVDPEKIILCFFGQFESSYDLETIIEAAYRLDQSEKEQVQFVLCGDGTNLPRLKNKARGLSNVVFPGWISSPTIYALMEISQIGLAPYATKALQSLPNKPIEYMAGGLPVLSSLHGELEQLLDVYQCGITYQAGDVGSFLGALRTLIYDPVLRIGMGDNARKLYLEKFSARHVYTKMINYLEKVSSYFKKRG